jgi:tryptophan-rich sensory protein
MRHILTALPFLAVVFVVAATGSRFMPGAWYEALARPAWTPPNWLFGPVWTILYFMIAIAGWRVWLKAGFAPVLIVWGVGLILNMAWSWIMFDRHQIGMALADITLLWLAILAFIVMAWPVDRTAAWLFVPYIVWVSYATALNFAIWRLNPAG